MMSTAPSIGGTLDPDTNLFFLQSLRYHKLIEKFKTEARKWEARPDGQMSLHIETLCGGVAGGLAGFLTTPLDVMKTLLQTQVKKPTVCFGYTRLSIKRVNFADGRSNIILEKLIECLNRNNVDWNSGGTKVLHWYLGWTQVESEASRSHWRPVPWRWSQSLLDIAPECSDVCDV